MKRHAQKGQGEEHMGPDQIGREVDAVKCSAGGFGVVELSFWFIEPTQSVSCQMSFVCHVCFPVVENLHERLVTDPPLLFLVAIRPLATTVQNRLPRHDIFPPRHQFSPVAGLGCLC